MTDLSLEIKRILKAPIQRVFDAWTDPEQLQRWHYPKGMSASEASSDPVPGGAYQIRMVDPAGGVHKAVGTYKEVDPPNKLVFSWGWAEGGGGPMDTQVTVLLKSVAPDQTELTLIHERFDSVETRDSHQDGWSGAIDQLETFLASD